MIKVCKNCSKSFGTEITKKVSCSRYCSQQYRQKNIYKDKYTYIYRSSSPRNFLSALTHKKTKDRALSLEFLENMYNSQKGLCALSGKEMTYFSGIGRVPTNISIDRIDSSIGYEELNIQLVCIQANKMKAELLQNDLLDWCSNIINYDKRKKK